MVVIARTMKRPKRRTTTDLHNFHEFPSSCSYDGPFRSNVVDFLERFARPPPPISDLLPLPLPPHLRPWRVSFRVAGDEDAAAVDLDVVEEDVAVARSVYCDHCRVVGWSGHPVCGKRYHFIIRSGDIPAARVHQICIRCGTMFESSDTRCTNCNYELSAEDVEEWSYRQLEDSTHLLHGVVHSNGYGHLLRVNGREGGSKVLKGCDIMGFWNRLCIMLRVRKISVMDISKKYGLEYRLLHAITAGRTWYGEWGYEFGAGSFALTAESYLKALDTVSNMEISLLFSHNRGPRTKLHDVIAFYWSLSDRRLFTLRDLFCFLVELIDDAHQRKKSNILSTNTTDKVECPWSTDEVKCVDNVMVKILRAAGVGRWVSWRTLRGALSHSGASFQLLDYCLKRLTGRVTDDGLVVVSKCNADSNAIEYRLEASLDSPLNPLDPVQSIQETCNRNPVPNMCGPTEEQLICDLRFLYLSLLNPDTMHPYKPRSTRAAVFESARKLLDCKQFVKSYDICSADLHPNFLRIWIEIVLLDEPQDYTTPPPELVVLPENANLGDLKLAVTRAFQETYLVFQKFQLQDIELGHVDDSTSIRLLLCDGCKISVRGRCHADHHRLGQFRMERGIENWIVECICGAKDDDGERMVACDSCSVWRHTRCMGIKDHEDVPKKFICWKCVRPPKVTVHPRRPNIKRSGENVTRISSKSISGMRIKAPMPLHKGSGKRCRFDGGDELVMSPTKSSISCVYSCGDNGEGAYKIASKIPCVSDAKLQGCGIDAGCGDRCKGVLMSPTKSDVNQLSCLTSVG